MRYDPDHEPDRSEWTALAEAQRIALVTEYHRRARIKLPNLRANAAMHVAVENQALMGDETPVAATLVRMMDEGLDRHDAVHAVASVLSGVMFDAIKGRDADDINATYFRELAELTADKWLSQSDDGGPRMIFSIDEERRLVARVTHQGEVEIFDCAADAACRNPVCRCRTTIVAMRPRTSGLPTRAVTFDLDARGIDEAFRKRASADDLVFGERLLSAMNEDDFDLLSRLHYAAKNRISEEARPSEINAHFDFDEIEGSSLLQAYNDILPFADTFRITLDGTDYVVLDQYCVKPGCRCTDAHLNLIPAEDHGQTVASAGAASVDYEAVSWEPIAGEPLPCDVGGLRRLMETASPDLYKQLRARHTKLRAIYTHCRRRELEALQTVLGGGTASAIGRNDPCPCGSGKKYKKCCLGKTAGSPPKAVDRMRTSTIISAIKTPSSP